jgi:hypothetical protein
VSQNIRQREDFHPGSLRFGQFEAGKQNKEFEADYMFDGAASRRVGA